MAELRMDWATQGLCVDYPALQTQNKKPKQIRYGADNYGASKGHSTKQIC